MESIRELSSPPIEEALLDIRVRPSEQMSSEVFSSLGERLPSEKYPQVELAREELVRFGIDEDGPKLEREPSAVRPCMVRSEDGRLNAQFRKERFTFNLLKNYRSWEELESEALSLWRFYEELAKPQSVVRVATRFVNRMVIPPQGDIGDFLVVSPGLPEEISEGVMADFVTRVSFFSGVLRGNITQRMERPDHEDLDLVLDIEIFREFEPASELEVPLDEEHLRDVLAKIRKLKNTVFYSSVTDTLLSKYE